MKGTVQTYDLKLHIMSNKALGSDLHFLLTGFMQLICWITAINNFFSYCMKDMNASETSLLWDLAAGALSDWCFTDFWTMG